MTTINSPFIGNDRSTSSSNEDATSLLLDVYLLPKHRTGTTVLTLFKEQQEILIDLANLSVQLNTYIQQHSIHQKHSGSAVVSETLKRPYYQWISGGDGPVFGIHCSPNTSLDPSSSNHEQYWNDQQRPPGTVTIPHLRTICRYGVCVNDEWCLIGLVLDFLENTKNVASESGDKITPYEIAVECWDIDDGQILLIEGAQSIPQWVDDIGPNNCSHRCWIRTSYTHAMHSVNPREKWEVQLLRPNDTHQAEPLPLGAAIQLLTNQQLANGTSKVEDAPKSMVETILQRIRISRTEQFQCQRAAVVLPESVVRLFHHRPDCIATACQMFMEHIQDPIPVTHRGDYVCGVCDRWIWTTLPFPRTAYAMLRTAISPPEWIYEDSIVPSVLATSSLEVKRYRRQCAVESTPHLRYGLQLGVRLLAGLHHCVQSQSKMRTHSYVDDKMTSTERRVLQFWSRVATECVGVDASTPNTKDWISDAWYAGPNNTKYDLQPLLQCPVFIPEIQSSITPLTCPDCDFSEQVRKELLRPHREKELSSNPPHHTEVDNEDWMWTLSTSKDILVSNDTQSPSVSKNVASTTSNTPPEQTQVSTLDEMLTGVQTFMDGTSTMNGVETSKTLKCESATPIEINPTLFMNILHTALKSESAQELSDKLNEMNVTRNTTIDDPFFSEDDYRLMDPSTDSDHESDDDDNDHHDTDTMNMEDMMNVMDAELRAGTSTSRAWDNIVDSDVNSDVDIARNAHVLSNLLKSMDAGGGGPGPMRNILLEMGNSVKMPNAGIDIEYDNDA